MLYIYCNLVQNHHTYYLELIPFYVKWKTFFFLFNKVRYVKKNIGSGVACLLLQQLFNYCLTLVSPSRFSSRRRKVVQKKTTQAHRRAIAFARWNCVDVNASQRPIVPKRGVLFFILTNYNENSLSYENKKQKEKKEKKKRRNNVASTRSRGKKKRTIASIEMNCRKWRMLAYASNLTLSL